MTVRPAGRADRADLLDVLAAAFTDDPVARHLLPPEVRNRPARLRRLVAMDLSRSERVGGTWTTSEGDGAAVWFPPGTWWPSRLELLGQVPAAVRVFGRRLRRAGAVQQFLFDHHPARPHWYLYRLGVRPDRQRTGIGSALLAPVLEGCDRDGRCAYLEASTERSRALYARHGFAALDPIRLPADGPTVYPMWRDPA